MIKNNVIIKYVLFILLMNLNYSCSIKKHVINNLKENYDQQLNGSSNSSIKKMEQFASSKNGKFFISYSHFTNANNMMYSSTNDVKYLRYNFDLFQKLIDSGEIINIDRDVNNDPLKLSWITTFNKNELNHMIVDMEYLLYEAYFIRYAAETIYLTSNHDSFSKEEWIKMKLFVEGIFHKWYDRSIERYGDDSLLHSIRVHMGSHMAQASMFFLNIDTAEENKLIYRRVFNDFTKGLKGNMVVVGSIDSRYYWNASWDHPFTKYQKSRIEKGQDIGVVEDTPHANHTVEFIIKSYEMNEGNWSSDDIEKLVNTWRFLFDTDTNKFADLINGEPSKEQRLKNKSHQQFGWVPLIKYDNSLIDSMFYPWYEKNKPVLINSYLVSETIAQLVMAKRLKS